MIIDSNLYWFDEDIFESEEKMEAFLASAPKQYDTKVHAGTLPDGRPQIIIERLSFLNWKPISIVNFVVRWHIASNCWRKINYELLRS